jgi:hypothetical protein
MRGETEQSGAGSKANQTITASIFGYLHRVICADTLSLFSLV